MLGFAFGRALQALSTLLAIATLAFALVRLAPGGPFGSDKELPAAVRANMERHYKLDRPAFFDGARAREGDLVGAATDTQYGHFLRGLVRLDLGPSFKYRNRTVNEIVASSFPVSAHLGLFSLWLALAAGIPLGAAAAARPRGAVDRAAAVFAALGLALPSFLLAALLVIPLGFWWRLLPVAGWGTWRHLILPGVALSIPYAAHIARLTRASVAETLAQDFVRTARAKGLPPRYVLYVHALRPALLPVVSYLGPASAGILTGSLVVEQVFAVPGLGSHFVNAALNRDYTLVLGTVLLYSTLIVALNAFVDVAYAWLDPRVKGR